MFKQTKAFTILELVIVISVLAILIGIAIPTINGMRQHANVSKAKAEIQTIMSAVESYYTFGSPHAYPPAPSPGITNLQQTYLVNTTPNIISSPLYDPFAANSTTEYSYMTSGNGQYYVIWSASLPGANPPTNISNSGVISY